MARKQSRRSRPTQASLADRYDLYVRSVQTPEHEVPFFDRVYRRHYGRAARVLREDFCGTFAVCCEWVKSRDDRIAIGVDIDSQPLQWGRTRNLAKLELDQQKRVVLLQNDVRNINGRKADVVAAQNFSFWIFNTREALHGYFQSVYQNLTRQGVFVLDMMGGSETIEENHTDVTKYAGFTYLWEQARFDPITHECSYYIHFRFDDGSEMHRAFEYHWRFWTLPEVNEVLREVGFNQVNVYWEDTDSDTEEGNGVYRQRKHAPSDPAWICYVVAVK